MGTNLKRAAHDWALSLFHFYRAGLLMKDVPYDGDWEPDTWAAMSKWYDGLVAEHAEITEACREVAQYSKAKVLLTVIAQQMDQALVTVESDEEMPEEAFSGPTTPTEGGGLPGLMGLAARRPGGRGPAVPTGIPPASGEAAREAEAAKIANETPTPWDNLALFATKAFKAVIGVFTVTGTVAGVLFIAKVTNRNVLQSPAERAADEGEYVQAQTRERAKAIASCKGNQGCMDGVNRYYDMIVGAQSCELWDTPVSDVIGGVVGTALGYVGTKRLMGG